jgi:hypothetical protein
MENEKRLLFLASEVTIAEEEDKLNPVFLSITLKLADNLGNRNDEGITAEFISDLIKRQKEFECLPFYADVDNLLARNYDKLSHKFNRITKRFSTTQIGSCTDFYSEVNNDGVVSLYATARVPKREREICLRLAELYEMGQLWVSFEIRYNPEHTIQKDGVLFIDAHEDNALTGIALVSVPAVADAGALDMVAEVVDDSEDIVAGCEEQAERGETEPMEKENITAEVTEEEKTEAVAEVEEAHAEEETAVAEEQEEKQENHEEEEEDEQKEDAVAETQEANAEVLEHSVDTHESVENWGGEPVHVFEYRERVIETMDDAQNLVAELDAKIVELEEIKSKYDAMIAEQVEKEMVEKKEKAKAFAEKQGLDVTETAVAEAIESLDYAKIAELTMSQVQEEEPAKEEVAPAITLASFSEMEIGEDKYGGLLTRRNK